MTTLAILDAILLATAAVWLGLSAALLIDRARYDRRAVRLESVRQQLNRAEGTELERLPAGVGTVDFDRLVSDGVPSRVEIALARALLDGDGREAVVSTALGSTRADVWERVRAAQVLTVARDGAAHEALDLMLRSGERVLAGASLRFLVDLDDPESAHLMVRALVDGVHSRSRIAAAFNALSVERADALAPMFSSEEPSCRYWAARLACFLGSRRWTSRVRELTDDTDPFVRRAAVEAVGVLGGAEDVPVVLQLFSDPAPVVRAHAVRAAAALPGTRNVAALRSLLDDSAWIVRSAAAEVLSAGRSTDKGDAVPA